jgi:hypothetical protein
MFYQIVITLMLGAHPMTYTMPKLWYATDYAECVAKADAISLNLAAHQRKRFPITVSCEMTSKRDA